MSYRRLSDVYSVQNFYCYCVDFVGQNLLTYINFMQSIIVYVTLLFCFPIVEFANHFPCT